jgi:4'-phosphopantetheinyl transferase
MKKRVITLCATNINSWNPDQITWTNAFNILAQHDSIEADKVMKFRIDIDRKRALIGRLLSRIVSGKILDRNWKQLEFTRTENGKPFINNLSLPNYNFNVSHHGEWIVFIGGLHFPVGIDVMRYDDPPRGKTAFLNSFTRHFTEEEWLYIRRKPEDELQEFYRFWALKESYVKALGVGIGFNLLRVSFTFSLAIAATTTTTTLPSIKNKIERASACVDGKPLHDWCFFVTSLDDLHCVAIACGTSGDNITEQDIIFDMIDVNDILLTVV